MLPRAVTPDQLGDERNGAFLAPAVPADVAAPAAPADVAAPAAPAAGAAPAVLAAGAAGDRSRPAAALRSRRA